MVEQVPEAQLTSLGEVLEKEPDIENPYRVVPPLAIVIVNVQEGAMLMVWLVGPSPTMVAGLGPQPLIVNVAVGAPTGLMSSTTGCWTVVMVKTPVSVAAHVSVIVSGLLLLESEQAPVPCHWE